MMKPTSNTVLINGKQGAADQGRGFEGREGEALIDSPPPLWGRRRRGRSWRRRRMASRRTEEGRVRPAGSS